MVVLQPLLVGVAMLWLLVFCLAKGLLKVSGQPLKIEEVEDAIRAQLGA